MSGFLRRLFRRFIRPKPLTSAIAAHTIHEGEYLFILRGRAYRMTAQELIKRP